MQRFKTIVLFLLVIACSNALLAQRTPGKPAAKPFQKIKPPKLQTTLGTYKDSVGVPVSVADKLIGMPIKIYDDNKVEYAVSSYQFLYRKREVSEDESGKAIPATSVSSDRFKISPLPDLWVNLIRQRVKSGEEFYFFDVIAKDSQGRVMYASDLKITIQ